MSDLNNQIMNAARMHGDVSAEGDNTANSGNNGMRRLLEMHGPVSDLYGGDNSGLINRPLDVLNPADRKAVELNDNSNPISLWGETAKSVGRGTAEAFTILPALAAETFEYATGDDDDTFDLDERMEGWRKLAFGDNLERGDWTKLTPEQRDQQLAIEFGIGLLVPFGWGGKAVKGAALLAKGGSKTVQATAKEGVKAGTSSDNVKGLLQRFYDANNKMKSGNKAQRAAAAEEAKNVGAQFIEVMKGLGQDQKHVHMMLSKGADAYNLLRAGGKVAGGVKKTLGFGAAFALPYAGAKIGAEGDLNRTPAEKNADAEFGARIGQGVAGLGSITPWLIGQGAKGVKKLTNWSAKGEDSAGQLQRTGRNLNPSATKKSQKDLNRLNKFDAENPIHADVPAKLRGGIEAGFTADDALPDITKVVNTSPRVGRIVHESAGKHFDDVDNLYSQHNPKPDAPGENSRLLAAEEAYSGGLPENSSSEYVKLRSQEGIDNVFGGADSTSDTLDASNRLRQDFADVNNNPLPKTVREGVANKAEESIGALDDNVKNLYEQVYELADRNVVVNANGKGARPKKARIPIDTGAIRQILNSADRVGSAIPGALSTLNRYYKKLYAHNKAQAEMVKKNPNYEPKFRQLRISQRELVDYYQALNQAFVATGGSKNGAIHAAKEAAMRVMDSKVKNKLKQANDAYMLFHRVSKNPVTGRSGRTAFKDDSGTVPPIIKHGDSSEQSGEITNTAASTIRATGHSYVDKNTGRLQYLYNGAAAKDQIVAEARRWYNFTHDASPSPKRMWSFWNSNNGVTFGFKNGKPVVPNFFKDVKNKQGPKETREGKAYGQISPKLHEEIRQNMRDDVMKVLSEDDSRLGAFIDQVVKWPKARSLMMELFEEAGGGAAQEFKRQVAHRMATSGDKWRSTNSKELENILGDDYGRVTSWADHYGADMAKSYNDMFVASKTEINFDPTAYQALKNQFGDKEAMGMLRRKFGESMRRDTTPNLTRLRKFSENPPRGMPEEMVRDLNNVGDRMVLGRLGAKGQEYDSFDDFMNQAKSGASGGSDALANLKRILTDKNNTDAAEYVRHRVGERIRDVGINGNEDSVYKHLLEYGNVYQQFMGTKEYNSLTELAKYMSHKAGVMGELGKVSPAPEKIFHIIMEGFSESGTPLASLFTRMYNTVAGKSSYPFAVASSGIRRLEASKTMMEGEAMNRLITGISVDSIKHKHSWRNILEAFNSNAPDAETRAEKWLTRVLDAEINYRGWYRPGLGASDGPRGSTQELDARAVEAGRMPIEMYNRMHGRRPQSEGERNGTPTINWNELN